MQTLAISSGGFLRIIACRHVFARDDSQEGRQGAPLLERCREQARGGGRVLQRHVLYLGEINSSQELAWRKSIEVLEDGAERPRTLALFPEDRCEGLLPDASIVRLRLSQLRLCRPRQWGACWLALKLWQELQLDRFWAERLAASRKGTRWDQVLFVLVAYRLIAPGSEWRLASRVVRAQRAGRSAGRGCRAGRHPHALSLSRPAARAQAGAVRPPGRALARSVQRHASTCCSTT